jgi:DNA-binding MarR family transcriptional regulator
MMRAEDELIADLARLYTGIRRRFDREMLREGASLAQTKLLLMIGAENGTARAADLATRLGLAPRSVTEALDALEREGLIIRTPDPDDRRAKRLAITSSGAAAIAVTEPLRQRLCREIVSVLDDEERDRCHDAIKKMLHLLT